LNGPASGGAVSFLPAKQALPPLQQPVESECCDRSKATISSLISPEKSPGMLPAIRHRKANDKAGGNVLPADATTLKTREMQYEQINTTRAGDRARTGRDRAGSDGCQQ
jgi:hypothetical protein